ncbi:VCBS repeat-containing protein [Streptomyces sp. NPDC096079]|uniref:FG-GAP repeat domain-containing protein n=1 Tax=Streptomyces sp. NPDC096079 TaxID=3155820 RepID=UPI00331DFBC6
MLHPRRPRFALAAVVTVVLAVTAGTAVAAPADSRPVSAAAAAQDTVAPFPVDGYVYSSGPTGFLSAQSGTALTWRWTRYADGATTVLPESSYGSAQQTDIVTHSDGDGVFTLYDMGTGADPLEIDINPLGGGYAIAGFAGTRIVAKKANASGGTDLHVIGKPQGVLVDDTVTGLPADATVTSVFVNSPDSALVQYSVTVDGTKRSHVAVLDVAAHAVAGTYERAAGTTGGATLSATHVAWVEKGADSTSPVSVAVARRDTGEVVRHDLGVTDPVVVQLVGDWVTYRTYRSTTPGPPNPRFALYARSLATGETVRLLDHTINAIAGPDGTQIARGGTVEHGEGLYRIAPGADGGRPAVTLVASTGEPTAVEFLGHAVPGTIDLDRETAPVQLNWTLSRWAQRVRVELVHTATKKTWKPNVYSYGGGVYGFPWNGMYAQHWLSASTPYRDAVPAPNGDYTWRITAESPNGIGPALERTGAFTVVRKAVPHDFNDNGSPDLLARYSSGQLVLFNTPQPLGAWSVGASEPLGTGWNTYDRLLSPGDVGGTPDSDVIGRDRTGALWLHQGTGRGLASRTKIGVGWQIYDKVAAGSDLTGDGRPDLVATDTTGALWLYKGTGDTTAPYAPRVRTGTGWGAYNQLTATGNLAGGPAGDLVARDKDGILWLYLGKGDGTFAPRIRVGGGWFAYDNAIGIGDVDRDGRNDLMATTTGAGEPYFYKGTGDWRVPFQGRTPAYSHANLPDTVF